ncbi:FHA domain-containing protein [Coleofasciculus sp. FACHB-712]|uniref:FHA domain-containing protein n=1 Tax=Cyanophyceae TaxID=3028117 RepID=UPI001685C97E|nr:MULTISPECIES: FHA domain-containing protein [unclassified Coleofasciculus]MBD1838045.1 FHA domain-containing protein [Coleofasciculus sp. FACHB-501]MBD1896619.1 FHA domain-containing protein [Coleofasciculus sp. FACHB-129]MBD1944034.1 FHA domain-containing protein [Coleofasciculus sp. FACHB-712]
MNELTLEWQEAGRGQTQTIHDRQIAKHPGTIRIGRDPARCDIVLTDPTVSGLHVEIFFNPQQQSFYLRNLRESNPPLVDGHTLIQGEVPLSQGSTICLGQIEIQVTKVSLAVVGVPPTVLLSPPSPVAGKPAPTAPNPAAVTYGLECSSCHRVSPYNLMNLGCPWCGTSLAAALSVLVTPSSN